eukprot:425372-Rhodomonas_salina.1
MSGTLVPMVLHGVRYWRRAAELLWCYAATRCPVLRYAMSGTDIGYAATRLKWSRPRRFASLCDVRY